MADDPLTTFRNKPITPRALTPSPSPTLSIPQPHPNDRREEYKAFEGKDRVDGLEIRRGPGKMSYIIMYNYIHSLSFDDDNGALLVLVVSGYYIEIHGKNLNPIAAAIRKHYCEYIQEFRSDRFVMAKPVDESATCVDRIDVDILCPKGEREPA